MKTINIMHLEDDSRDADLVVRELTKAEISFKHTIVSSKKEFIECLEMSTPDIILSDHSLPAFNSLEALKIVKYNGLSIPFILVTGNTSEEFAVSVMKAGANDYILKDRIQRLPLAINNALDKFELDTEKVKLQKERKERDKEASEKINKIARKLQLAANSAEIGIWEWDIIHNHLDWDKGMCRLYGTTPSPLEFVYDDWLFRIHSQDRRRIDEHIQLTIAGKKEYNTEFRIILDDGTIRYVRAAGIIERDRIGNAISMTGVNWDITRLKNDEAKIKESELRYRSLIEQATDAICIADSSMKFVDMNPIASKMFGYSKEEILKLSITDILFEDGLTTNQLKMDEVRSGETIRHERRLKRKDGTVVVMEVSAKMLEDGTFILFGHDITKRKEAEDKIITTSGILAHGLNDLNKIMNSSLEKAEQEMMWLIDNTEECFILLNHDLQIVSFNKQFKHLYALYLGIQVAKGDSILDYAQPERRGILKETYKRVLEGNEEYDEIVIPIPGATEKIFAIKYKPAKDEQGEIIGAFVSVVDITEKRNAEQRLIINEKRYRALIEEGADAIVILTPDGKPIYIAPTLERVLGYTEAEAMQLDLFSLTHPDDIEGVMKLWQQVLESRGVPVPGYPSRILHKDGTWRWIEGVVTNMLHDPAVNGIVDNFRDITAFKNYEIALIDVNKKLETAQQIAQLGYWEFDILNDVFTFNDQFYAIFKTTAEKVGGYTMSSARYAELFIHPDDREIVGKSVEEAINSDNSTFSYKAEHRIIYATGEIGYISVHFYLVKDNEGRTIRTFGVNQDITERKNVEAEIIKEKNLSDSIIKSLPCIFYLFSKEGKLLRWNRNLETVTKYSAAEIIEMHPFDFFDETEKELITQKIANVFISGEENVQANFQLKTKEKIPYYFTAIAVEYEGSSCLMGLGIDVSESVKAQEKIRKITDQSRQLAVHLQNVKEEERKRIGHEIHDELGQQLTAIHMDVAWIDKQIPEETTLLKRKLKNMIQLLDGSHQSIRRILSELRPGILDDHGLLDAIVWLGARFTENTGIPVNFTTTETEIKSSELVAICIFRVFQEALTNITRYANARKVSISLSIIRENITVIIEDDGIGFDEASVQNRKSFGLLGMKTRVLSLGGQYEIITHPGKGTKILIELPGNILN